MNRARDEHVSAWHDDGWVLVEGLVMPRPEVVITFAAQKFDVESGRLIDEPTREHLGRWLEAFVAWIERVRD